jgi:hypothetical protein
MKLDNNIIEWNNPKIIKPKQDSFGGYSINVLTLLQDNGKTGGINRYVFNTYDYVLEEWQVKGVIAWTYLKEYKHLQDYHIDDYC